MLSPARARRLKPLLDALLDRRAALRRREGDPVRFVHRYERPEDAELVGLVAASFAYGRVDLFLPRLEEAFAAMGPRPSAFAQRFVARRDGRAFEGFAYRFNNAADLAALVGAAGRVQREAGGLGAAFAAALRRRGTLREALSDFVAQLRGAVDPGLERELGPLRGFDHLLPDPRKGGACKRLLLYLRWMVRGGAGDPVDLGLWRDGVPASALVVPLDTHVARVGRNLRLTDRRDLGWRTAEEITASLRLLDPGDPVRYDFALCHHGMSGACPLERDAQACARCALRSECPRASKPTRA